MNFPGLCPRATRVAAALVLLSLCLLPPSSSFSRLLPPSPAFFQDTFPGPGLNPAAFDTRFADFALRNGNLILRYSSAQVASPSGIECTPPAGDSDAAERTINLSFLGGGSELSNSLFICYAVGPGWGLSLPTLPSMPSSNDRTGYIIRPIRHGDGTNEVKFYRNDFGWVKEIKNDWTLPANPVTTIRRAVIRHRRNGEHHIALTFDTGLPFEKIYDFADSSYPPDTIHRGIQLIAKGHTYSSIDLDIRTDTWTVSESPSPFLPPSPVFSSLLQSSPAFSRLLQSSPAPLPSPSSPALTDDALDSMGLADMDQHNYYEASVHLSKALDMRKKKYGPEDLKVAESLDHLGKLYTNKNFAEAERYYVESLRIRTKKFARAGPGLLPSLDGLIDVYCVEEKYAEAEPLFKLELTIMENTSGTDSRELAARATKLAMIYAGKLNRPGDAEPLFKQALDLREKNLPPDSLDLEAAVFNLAADYHVEGRFAEAETLYLRALAIKELALGKDHPDVAGSLSKLARLYVTLNRFAEAEPLFKRVMDIRQKSLGQDHPFTWESMRDMAQLDMREGRDAEAEGLYKLILNIQEEHLGPDNHDAAVTMNDLASFYSSQRRFAEALPLYKNSLRIMEKEFGRNGPDADLIMSNIAMIHLAEKRYADAEPLYKELLSYRTKRLGKNHADVIDALDRLAIICAKLNRPKESKTYAERAKKIREKNVH